MANSLKAFSQTPNIQHFAAFWEFGTSHNSQFSRVYFMTIELQFYPISKIQCAKRTWNASYFRPKTNKQCFFSTKIPIFVKHTDSSRHAARLSERKVEHFTKPIDFPVKIQIFKQCSIDILITSLLVPYQSPLFPRTIKKNPIRCDAKPKMLGLRVRVCVCLVGRVSMSIRSAFHFILI